MTSLQSGRLSSGEEASYTSGGQSCPAYSSLPRPFGVKASSCHLEALPLDEVRYCMPHCDVPLRDAVRYRHHDDGLLPDGVRHLHHCDVLLLDDVGCCMPDCVRCLRHDDALLSDGVICPCHGDALSPTGVRCLRHADLPLPAGVTRCLLRLGVLPLVRVRRHLLHCDVPSCDLAALRCVTGLGCPELLDIISI